MEDSMSSAVIFPAQPENILKGLGKLWTSLGQEEKQQGKPTVLRACAMTLIVATDEPDSGFAASQTISELMHAHPARGIVLAVSSAAEKSLEARVLAQCWKPFGKAQQICCEQIEITARPQSWPNVGPTLIGLTVADLPVIFWCRHKGALSRAATGDEQAGLEAVTDLATKVVIDTRGMPAADATSLLERWQARGRVIADLEWTRLTSWREPLAHLFDVCDIMLADFHSIEIEYTDAEPGMGALYMGGWLSLYRPKVSFRRADGYLPGVHRVTLRSDSKTIDFARTGPDSAVLHSAGGRECTYNFGEPAVTALMTEELALMGVDPAFNAAFGRVRGLLPDKP
jgi:glucose-6-phosphate dehydrogenase assembly protein OpcA